jgi:phage recombination protein Bet
MANNSVVKADSIRSLAPAGIDPNVWLKTLKDQLLNSKQGAEVSNAELMYLATVSHNSGLDPTTRQIYGIFRNVKQKDGTYKPHLTIQTSIDGLRVIAERSGKYAGSDEPEFEYDPDYKITVTVGGGTKTVPNKARVTVTKIMEGMPYKTTRTAKWQDYFPGEREGNMWKKLPETMLAKVAEAQALRAAFPNETSGLYIEEEMQQADNGPDGQSVDVDAIKTRIANAKTRDDLMDILGEFDPDMQKRITPWIDSRAKELL